MPRCAALLLVLERVSPDSDSSSSDTCDESDIDSDTEAANDRQTTMAENSGRFVILCLLGKFFRKGVVRTRIAVSCSIWYCCSNLTENSSHACKADKACCCLQT